MKEQFRIDSAPEPPRHKRGGFHKYPWASLNVGDSFLITGRNGQHINTTTPGRKYGRRFTQEVQPNGDVRVWRIS